MACPELQAVPVPSGLSLGEVLRAGLPGYARRHRLPAAHWKVLNAIQACRTPLLGGHQYECAFCGCAHFAPHGCGNRHCPTCQGSHSRQWLAAQAGLLLPIPYFHNVFTLPHELNPLIQQNQRALYRLLFDTVSETLLQFGRHNLGAQLGVTAVLHTWWLVASRFLHGVFIARQRAMEPFDGPLRQEEHKSPGFPMVNIQTSGGFTHRGLMVILTNTPLGFEPRKSSWRVTKITDNVFEYRE